MVRRPFRSISGRRFCLAVVALLSLGSVAGTSSGSLRIEVVSSEALVSFPDRIDFRLTAETKSEIVVAEVEYGVEMLSCSTEVSRAVPQDFAPSDRVDVTYTWDMRRTGSLAPGARIWWRWHVVDGKGNEFRTETEWLTWIDSVHEWDAMSSGLVTVHWYEGDGTFARTLLSAASQAFGRLADELGTQPKTEIHIYVYDSTEAMRQAVLYEPGWTGGLAFSNQGIVIIGISTEDLEWGKGAIAHELAHVFVGTLVSHCYSYLPSWLSEGLAVYAEGGLDEGSREQLDEATSDNSLFSVRALNDAFTEQEGRAFLSYAQSFSLVSYLMEAYGRAKMLELLEAFQAGYRADHALLQVYGFDVEGLERVWRLAIKATPMAEAEEASQATPTVIPTLRPFAGPPRSATLTPLPAEAGAADNTLALPASESSSVVLGIVLMCGFFTVLVAALAAAGLRYRKRKAGGTTDLE
jgi:hypothetical protein